MMTEKEKMVATVIADTMDMYCEFFSDVDFEILLAETEFTKKTLKGVLGSLDKKGYIFEEDVNGETNMYYLTANGFVALRGEVPEYLD